MDRHVEREDVDAILSGLFDMNRKLARIDRNLEVITRWLENGDDDEEEEEEDPPGSPS